MTINQLYQKAFVGGKWNVAFRLKDEKQFKVVETPKDIWIADPILFSKENEEYLFVEVYEKKKKKAAIGYYQFVDGNPVYKGIIISNSYHMSYPYVFSFDGNYYMIPESSANDTITLYKAEKFPDKWCKVKDLISGEKYVDSTVIKDKDKIYLFTYKAIKNGWKLVHFELDMEKYELKEKSHIFYDKNIGRPAGVCSDNKKRVAQDCRKKYGENLLVYTIESFEPYNEKLEQLLNVDYFNVDKKYARVHTYSESEKYEAIDLFEEKFDIFHGIKIFCRAYLKK